MSKFGWCVTPNDDGWYLFPSVYVWPVKNKSKVTVMVDVGFTFLRWSFVVTWFRYQPFGGIK